MWRKINRSNQNFNSASVSTTRTSQKKEKSILPGISLTPLRNFKRIKANDPNGDTVVMNMTLFGDSKGKNSD